MGTEEKKFSFSFTKHIKKSNIINSNTKSENEDVQLIDCVEANSIKVIGGDNKVEKLPLVIPLIKNKTSNEDLKDNDEQHSPSENSKTDMSLEDIAVQELINESKNITAKPQPLVFEIPKLSQNDEITGEPESTLDDYENIPISEFGFAMLRGMGWKDDEGIGKNHKTTKLKMPNVRPKGMGLGADKLNAEKNRILASQINNTGEQLKIIKNAYVKIISGRYNNMLGQVQGFDDDAGSVIIKLSLNGNIVSLQEFLIVPVTKTEYDKNSKVLNLQKYEEYGKKDTKEVKYEMKESKKSHKRNDNHSDKLERKYFDNSNSENESKSTKHRSNKSYNSDSDDDSVSNRNQSTKKYELDSEKFRHNSDSDNSEVKHTKYKNHSKTDSESEHEHKSHRKDKKHHRDHSDNKRYESKGRPNDDDTDAYRDRSRHYEKYRKEKYNSDYVKHKSTTHRDQYDDKHRKSSKSRRSRSK